MAPRRRRSCTGAGAADGSVAGRGQGNVGASSGGSASREAYAPPRTLLRSLIEGMGKDGESSGREEVFGLYLLHELVTRLGAFRNLRENYRASNHTLNSIG